MRLCMETEVARDFFLKLILMFKDGKLQLDQSGQLGSTVI